METLHDKFLNFLLAKSRLLGGDGDFEDAATECVEIASKWIDENNWISVTDKMPEDRLGVLAYISDEDFITQCHYEYKIGQWMVSDTYRKLDSVTHWMPLPHSPNQSLHPQTNPH